MLFKGAAWDRGGILASRPLGLALGSIPDVHPKKFSGIFSMALGLIDASEVDRDLKMSIEPI